MKAAQAAAPVGQEPTAPSPWGRGERAAEPITTSETGQCPPASEPLGLQWPPLSISRQTSAHLPLPGRGPSLTPLSPNVSACAFHHPYPSPQTVLLIPHQQLKPDTEDFSQPAVTRDHKALVALSEGRLSAAAPQHWALYRGNGGR